MINRWKIAFFTMLGVGLAFIVTLIVLFNVYLQPANDLPERSGNEGYIETSTPIFTVTSTKKQLIKLINKKLDTYKNENVKYDVFLKDDLGIQGIYTAFGRDIEFLMTFSIETQTNGDLLLQEKSFRLGSVSLPTDKVLEFIRGGTSLPDWVKVFPDKGQVYIALTDIHIKDQFFLKAKEIELEKNMIQFSVFELPEK